MANPAPVAAPPVAPPADPSGGNLPERIHGIANITRNLWWSWQLGPRAVSLDRSPALVAPAAHRRRTSEAGPRYSSARREPTETGRVGVNAPAGAPCPVPLPIAGGEGQRGPGRVREGRAPVCPPDSVPVGTAPADRKLTARLYTSAPEWR